MPICPLLTKANKGGNKTKENKTTQEINTEVSK